MKRFLLLSLLSCFCINVFAQTVIQDSKLGKTLEKNKDEMAIFLSEIDLRKMSVAADGKIIIPILAKSKITVVSGMDMTDIEKRIQYSGKVKHETTFEVKDISSKTYTITNIEGIETFAQYKERVSAEEKALWERERKSNLTKMPVQVVNQEVINLGASETAWLPGQIQDKLKSNLQEFLAMKTVVDTKSEIALKKLQAESESDARDESTAIELGKITTAKFALFTKIRKTNKGYVISVDFTDLTTGEQIASVSSKEYSNSEYLYGSTGAVDEITLALGNKLGLSISDLNKNLLSNGSSSFSIDDQLALAKQNEAQFNNMMAQYDSELEKLNISNDISAIENKKRIEAEKAILTEKQNAERKRQEELNAQKKRADEDAKLEAERSIALKTQRDEMAKQAAAKASEVRKLKLEKQGVLGQINVIESKKKALVEIRQTVESRSQELYEQLVKDRESEENRIRNKTYSTVELGSDGLPTEQAKERREKQVIKSYEDLTNKFFADCEGVKKATQTQDSALLAEIRSDQKALSSTRSVSSLGEELKVSFGTYEGSKNGWNAYLSLYSDGVLLYTDSFIVNYEALSGKKAPDMAKELDDSVIEEYTNNVDMYNSLLVRGDPIIYFELDYNVRAESDDKPSEYNFNFNKIRVINTVSGKTVQTIDLNKSLTKAMKPEMDLQFIPGIVEDEKETLYRMKEYLANGYDFSTAKKQNKVYINYVKSKIEYLEMIKIPGTNIEMLKTEVKQWLYSGIMSYNPSEFKSNLEYKTYSGEKIKYNDKPVENVSWYDAIYFCNVLSEKKGLIPVYSVNGEINVQLWEYTPGMEQEIEGDIRCNPNANGFRLPTKKEWQYAARGGEEYKYAGSNEKEEVAWFGHGSYGRGSGTNQVAKMKPNGYGLYDMLGNVWELGCDDEDFASALEFGGAWDSTSYDISIDDYGETGVRSASKYSISNNTGFRIVRTYKSLK
ncbi:MAG: SUMF1/EgtB/PvdO family nonheme iron enzyme [Treponema sp.]|nr:SUMF1/EgtB/PvdO family nonheme iron enzyme [Treponema sp.]